MVLREMDCKLDGKKGIRGETVGWPWITLYIGRGHIESRLNLVHITDGVVGAAWGCAGCPVPGAAAVDQSWSKDRPSLIRRFYCDLQVIKSNTSMSEPTSHDLLRPRVVYARPTQGREKCIRNAHVQFRVYIWVTT